ncbi:MAG TPA: metallophosphoesterase [Longimicrobium sp.]|nr:metallophosphoesterase [Longimicrobium sp.]
MRETMDWTRRAAALAASAALLASAACGSPIAGVGRTVGPIPMDSVALNLVLIGDAGLPNPEGEPVLRALQNEIAEAPDKNFVVFLGDNLYPVGLVDTLTEPGREGLRILRAQFQPLRDTNTRGLFVPGNHDWGQGAPEGWQNIVRQERFINTEGAGLFGMEPRDGCPGPVVVDIGAVLRLIAIDTHWWLHPSTKGGPGRCNPGTEDGVVDSLRIALATAGDRRTVVVAHHPIVSGGSHGGYFDWPTYLFPFHPWARVAGLFARQDVTGREYRHMVSQLARAFVVDTPTVYAAGHEHNLQVFRRAPERRDPANYLLVSGGGIYGHTTSTRRITGIRYIREASGYQRITFLEDGRARLSVMVVDAEGNATEDFSMWLDVPPIRGTGAPPAATEGGR